MILTLMLLACGPDAVTDPTDTDGSTDTVEIPSDPIQVGALDFSSGVPTNLLIISLDTARWDYFGRYGDKASTPNIDAVLAEGVALDDHRSCSNWTGASFACILSGRMAIQNNFWPWTKDEMISAKPPEGWDAQTLPGLLDAQGYKTTLVTSNAIYSRQHDLTFGFDTEVRVDWQVAADVSPVGLEEVGKLMDSDKPWFAQVHYFDPHGEYCPPEEFVIASDMLVDRDFCEDSYGPGFEWYDMNDEDKADLEVTMKSLYASEMAYWDDEFGKFWAELETMGALDDTLVMFVTDHGQQFFEHNGHGHGIMLYAEENRAVAGFWAKNLAPAAWDGPTTHEDLAATVHALYGLNKEEEIEGILVGEAPEDRILRGLNYWGEKTAAGTTDPVRLSVIRGKYQMLYDWGGEYAFYDLATDPLTLTDVYDAENADVQDLTAEIEMWADEVHSLWSHLDAPNPITP